MDFLEFNIIDIIDIVLVAILLYQLYKLIKGTVAIKIFIGIAAIYLLWKIVEVFQMDLLSEILGQFIGVGVLAVIIVFQQEVRRFLLMIGNTKFFSKDGVLKFNWITDETAAEVNISDIVDACDKMAKTKTGSIIVITRENGLPNYIETGEKMNSQTSSILLQSIFFKNSPLHDGAVIITGSQVMAARCVLPTIENDSFPSNLGMRHRAAAGVSENTDCIAIVVSEERGKISVALKGQLEISLSREQLKDFLQRELHQN
ncbi:MAG: diadenylate cyclase CdaA [Flavobacteriales bacterium]